MGVHDGHRKKTRGRFDSSGLDAFQPHEILEMLLYYCIPRVNTNETAHELYNHFGSLKAVMSASPEALCEVKGVGEKSAQLITFLHDLYTQIEKEDIKGQTLDSFDAVKEAFRKLYYLESQEIVYVALLDNDLHLKNCVKIAEGHPSSVEFSARSIVQRAFAEKSDIVILAHNHPGCAFAAPSKEDIAVTRHLVSALRPLSIQLIDHVIVAQKEAASLRECGVFMGLDI